MLGIKIGGKIMTKIWKNFICLFFVLISIFFYIDFLKSSYFYVKEISLENELFLLDNTYHDNFAKFKGKNIWQLDFLNIENSLKKDVRIKNISVKKILPNRLNITLEEEKIFAKTKYANNMYFTNENGEIFAYNKEIDNSDLILIDIDNVNELESLVKIIEEIYKTNGEKLVSEVYYDKEGIIIVMLVDGTKIKTDKLVDWKKYNIAFVLYQDLIEKKDNIEYIDIRFSDFIVK